MAKEQAKKEFYVKEVRQYLANPGQPGQVVYSTVAHHCVIGDDGQPLLRYTVVSDRGRIGIINTCTCQVLVRPFYSAFCEHYLITDQSSASSAAPKTPGQPVVKSTTPKTLGQSSIYFKFRMHDKYGVVDTAGRVLVPFIYDELAFVCGGYAVRQGQNWGYLNTAGKFILPPRYQAYHIPNSAYNFGELSTVGAYTDFEFYRQSGEVIYGCRAVKIWRHVVVPLRDELAVLQAANAFIVQEDLSGHYRMIVFNDDNGELSVISHPIPAGESINAVTAKHHLEQYIVYRRR